MEAAWDEGVGGGEGEEDSPSGTEQRERIVFIYILEEGRERGSDYSQVHCCSGGRPFVWCRSLSNAGAPPH